MSNKRHETVADIVAEIRRLNPKTFLVSKWCCEPLPNRMRSYADRIWAAYKRLALPTPEQWTEIARQSVEMYDLKRENARLRAALKPVLEVEMDMYTSNLSMEIAINEAKRIFWSSSAKGKGGD